MRSTVLHRQSGLTTFVAMIFLLLLLIFAISAVEILGVNWRITNNTQSQKSLEAAAQQGNERMISNLANFNSPPAGETTFTIPNGTDSKFTVKVLGPTCIADTPASGYSVTYALAPSRTQWELRATSTDPTFGSKAEVHQGVSILMPAGSCK